MSIKLTHSLAKQNLIKNHYYALKTYKRVVLAYRYKIHFY